MNDLFRTISSPTRGSFKDRGSKFLAFAYPVCDEKEIRVHLDTLRKDYHDARHHSYAWRLGAEKEHYRVNDDGEPSGSAGKPILGQMQSKDLTDILVVVIRYFGGTLLGVGGLINAYRSATADAFDQARITECRVEERMQLEFGYERMNAVMKSLKDLQLKLDDQQFDMDCSLTLRVWIREHDRVLNTFSKIQGCKLSLIEE